MRILFIIFTISCLFITSRNEASNSREIYIIDASTLYVRLKPNLNAKIISKVRRNEEVKVLEVTDKFDKISNTIAPWIKIKTDKKKTGYAFGGFITRKIFYENSEALSYNIFKIDLLDYKSKGIIISKDCKLNTYPSDGSSIISDLKIGQEVEVIKRTYTKKSLNESIFWYYIKFNGKDGFVSSKDVIVDSTSINENVYGIMEYPVGMVSPEEHRYIETNSKVIVFSKSKNSVIQTFLMPEITDKLSFGNNPIFKKFIKSPYLIINHSWNHFSCCPIGYNGHQLYLLDEDGKISTNLFSWFEDIGQQDEPHADLKAISIIKNSIILVYEYYDSIGSPSLGHGKFKLYYKYNKNKITYNKVESKVIKTHRVRNGSFSYDDEHKLKRQLNIKLNRDILNKKFKDLSKLYRFVY